MKFLFDLGGIFFDWDPRYFYRSIFSSDEEMDYFLSEICNSEWNLRQDAGRLIKEGENELIQKFPNYTKEIQMYYSNHRNMIKKIFQSSVDQLFELKSYNYCCYALSNWSSETFSGMIDEYPFLKKFDGLLISGENKLVKPDIAIFKLAISRFKLIPEETVFVDDNLANIVAAKNLKFNTIHLTNPNNIKAEIQVFINY